MPLRSAAETSRLPVMRKLFHKPKCGPLPYTALMASLRGGGSGQLEDVES